MFLITIHISYYNITGYLDIPFVCLDPFKKTPEVALEDGGRHYGRVELTIGGIAGTICDDRFDGANACAICNELGYGLEPVFLP